VALLSAHNLTNDSVDVIRSDDMPYLICSLAAYDSCHTPILTGVRPQSLFSSVQFSSVHCSVVYAGLTEMTDNFTVSAQSLFICQNWM
jgi:hypothetical protein